MRRDAMYHSIVLGMSQDRIPVSCVTREGEIVDLTSDPETFTLRKTDIDATRPIDKDFAERLVISDEQRARVRGILEFAGVKL
jgi:hypothetical protein